ncbi:hypothetical protein R1sor_012390 [Riccia sorocarpa]|uniref:Uncharacterized protein n=1 Tax=Riccia sorocarpa TaxID=122646 RepID=A0ABD3I9U9_9MARC
MSVGWKRGHGPSKRKGSSTRQSSSNVQSPQMLRCLLRAVNAGTPQWKLVFPVSRRHSRQSQGKLNAPPAFGMASLVRVFPAMSNSPTSAALLAKGWRVRQQLFVKSSLVSIHSNLSWGVDAFAQLSTVLPEFSRVLGVGSPKWLGVCLSSVE